MSPESNERFIGEQAVNKQGMMHSFESQDAPKCSAKRSPAFMPAMIPVVPRLHPGESLYSLLARAVNANAFIFPKNAMREWFGRETALVSPDLPTRLADHQKQWESFWPFDNVAECIERVTEFPYHRPFLSEAQAAFAVTAMESSGSGMKAKIGRLANAFGASSHLRYCPLCRVEDCRSLEQPYFRRWHTLPEVHCCAIHGVLLVDLGTARERPHPARFVQVPGLSHHAPVIAAPEAALKFARASKELLELSLPVLDKEALRDTYISAMQATGYASKNGRVRMQCLKDSMLRHWQGFECFTRRTRLLSTTQEPMRWLTDLLHRPTRSLHPICHLLLIGVLFDSVLSFAKQQPPENAKNRDLVTATPAHDEAISHSREQEVLEDLSLSSRQAAKQLHMSVHTVLSKREARGLSVCRRPKRISPDVRVNAKELWGQGFSMAQVAETAGVCLSSAYRLVGQEDTRRRAQNKRGCKREIDSKRKQWMVVCEGASISKARGAHQALYSWLYRNDKLWLRAHNGAGARVRGAKHLRGPRVDWMERDISFAQQVPRAARAAQALLVRGGISRSGILRCLRIESMWVKNKHKLPRLEMAIQAELLKRK